MFAQSDPSELVHRRGEGAASYPATTSGWPSASSTVAGRKASSVPSPALHAHTTTTAAETSSNTLSQQRHSAREPYADAEITAIASSAAAVLTKAFLHPLDTLKCRMQLLRTDVPLPNRNYPLRQGFFHTRLRQLRYQFAGQWAPKYLYGGLPVKLVFYVPYQAVYLTSYNFAQRTLQSDSGEKLMDGTQRRPAYVWQTVLAAVFAETATCCLRVPMETMKMRVQSAATTGSLPAMIQMWQHGLRSNVRLLIPHTLIHDIPYSVIQWVVYETLRPWTQQWGAKLHAPPSSSSADGALTSASFFSRYGAELARTFFSGGFSGLLASTITVPLDNIRTRTVVATASDPALTVRKVVRIAYEREGLRAFVRGGGMRVVWVTMNMACFYPLFEGIRSVLQCRAQAAKNGP